VAAWLLDDLTLRWELPGLGWRWAFKAWGE